MATFCCPAGSSSPPSPMCGGGGERGMATASDAIPSKRRHAPHSQSGFSIYVSTLARLPHGAYRSLTLRVFDCPHGGVWQRFPKQIRERLKTMALIVDDFVIPEDKIRQAKTVFQRYDKRGQNKMSTNDLGPAFYALNLQVRDDMLKEWADLVDEDATGFIEESGFLLLYEKKLKEDADEKDLRDAFRVLDKNKRGEIDVKDLRWILTSLGDDLSPEDVDEMIRDTDVDGSGFVDFDEFYKLMTG